MQDEHWESVPGLDGYYSISNFGRIRREVYEITYKDGRCFFCKPKIIIPRLINVPNGFKNDIQQYVVNRVTIKGVRYNLSVARLVYYCFVETFELDDHLTVILFNDNDSLNIQHRNLYKATVKEKQNRMVDRDRFASPLASLTSVQQQYRMKRMKDKKSKAVDQLSLDGILLKHFNSLKEAAEHTGIHYISISLAARGKNKKAGNYRWKLSE